MALRPEVIQASEPDAWAVALLAGARCGARVVLDVHEHYPSRLDARLPAVLRPVARGALRLAMRVLGRAADAVVLAKDGLAGDFSPRTRLVPVRNHALVPPGLPRREFLARLQGDIETASDRLVAEAAASRTPPPLPTLPGTAAPS